MFIKKRTSGGRGEYEIAENFGSTSPHDLVGLELRWYAYPYGVRPTAIRLAEQGGKLRLRIEPNSNYVHIHRQVQAALLLPKPIRDESTLAGGRPVVMENRYVLRRMVLGDLTLDPAAGSGTFRLSSLECDNRSGNIEELDVADRISRIQRVHKVADEFPEGIRDLLKRHQDLLLAAEPLGADAEVLVKELMESVAANAFDFGLSYISGTDVLAALEEILQLPTAERPPPIDEIPLEEVQIRRREAVAWRRWAATRGVASAKFRRGVRAAYDSTCCVCGLRLPKNDYCEVPGVDAAHILPWADYDLDVTANGICLCKNHHWAFDQQMIAIATNTDGSYEVVVTDKARQAFAEDPASLTELMRVAGKIPFDRLPKNAADRPRAEFLAHLYQDVPLAEEL